MTKRKILCSMALFGVLFVFCGCGAMHELEMTGTYADLWRNGQSETEETMILCTAEETALKAELPAECAADTAAAAQVMCLLPDREPAEIQPMEINLVLNQVEAGVVECLDFQITVCEDAAELAAEAGLAESICGLTLSSGSIISTPVRAGGTDLKYLFHDRVLTYASWDGGVVSIAVCDIGEMPVRDYYLACGDPVASDFGGVLVTVVSFEDEYCAAFSVGDRSYDIRTKGVSEDTLCAVISELCRG